MTLHELKQLVDELVEEIGEEESKEIDLYEEVEAVFSAKVILEKSTYLGLDYILVYISED